MLKALGRQGSGLLSSLPPSSYDPARLVGRTRDPYARSPDCGAWWGAGQGQAVESGGPAPVHHSHVLSCSAWAAPEHPPSSLQASSGKIGTATHLRELSGFMEIKYVKGPRLPRWLSGKESACQCRRRRSLGFNPWVGRSLWKRKWQPTPVFLPGEYGGQRSLAGCSPLGSQRMGQDLATEPQQQMSRPQLRVGLQHPVAPFLSSSSSFIFPSYSTPLQSWVLLELQSYPQGFTTLTGSVSRLALGCEIKV